MSPIEGGTEHYIIFVLNSIPYPQMVHNSTTANKFKRWQQVREKELNGKKVNQKPIQGSEANLFV